MIIILKRWFTFQIKAVDELGTALAKNVCRVVSFTPVIIDKSSAAIMQFSWTIRFENVKVNGFVLYIWIYSTILHHDSTSVEILAPA